MYKKGTQTSTDLWNVNKEEHACVQMYENILSVVKMLEMLYFQGVPFQVF